MDLLRAVNNTRIPNSVKIENCRNRRETLRESGAITTNRFQWFAQRLSIANHWCYIVL